MEPKAPQGLFGKIMGKLFSGVAARAQQDDALCQNYANSHGYVYTSNNQQPLLDVSGNKSAVMAAGNGILSHRINGNVTNKKFDTCLWSFEVNPGNKVIKRYYYIVGRVELSKTAPSLIIKPLKAGLGLDDPNMFVRFKNAVKEQLEGNFNEYFDVYTSSDDPVNAFELLPPNVMAKLVDSYSNICIELMGNSAYLFMPISPISNGAVSIVQQPLFDPAIEDSLIQRLVEISDFYKPSTGSNTTSNQNEMITNNPGIVIKT